MNSLTFQYFLILMGYLLLFSCGQPAPDVVHPRLGGWDYDWMMEVKASLQEVDEYFKPAYEQLLIDAEEALNEGPYSVTKKDLIPPSGSKHDYMSIGPYWWPDPEKEDGLPYIRRDGEVNPERNKTDRPQLGRLISSVRILSLAWFFTAESKYSEKAADLLKVWFIEEETRMNPHLEFAQAIPGRNPGRFIGVIDGTSFHVLVDAIALLETSGSLDLKDMEEIRSWFTRYFRWLVESEHGKNEDAYKNNHSVAYDVQSSGIAYFIGDDDFVARKVRELPRRRIDPMIEADGSQPHELIRTRAFSYSVGNLDNFIQAGEKGLKVDVNIFNYKNTKGASLKSALDYLLQYVGKENEWPYQQISSWEEVENRLGLIVRRAALIYHDDTYKRIWHDIFEERVKSDWSLLVIPGISN